MENLSCFSRMSATIRRQEIDDKPKSKERKKEEPKDVHSDLL